MKILEQMDDSEENRNYDRMLTCVLFPGVVKNDERALQCLGGIKMISQTCAISNKKRLGLNFQPENPFMKRIFADAHTTAGVLLKVKVKKFKDGDKVVKKEVVSTSVLGRVNKIFKFESMCDFQYLPVERDSNGKHCCILDNLIPSGVDTVDFLMNPCSQLIVPSVFTRFDKPTSYCYTDKKYLHENKEVPVVEEDIHIRTRVERSKPQTKLNFNLIDELPTEPHEFHLDLLRERIKVCSQLEQEYDIVKKKFEERPIWTVNLLRYYTKIKLMSMKIILPCLAFYYYTGPWRKSWVVMGYDPRKHPEARMYQTLDFRLRATAGLHSLVRPRDQVLQYRKPDRVRHLKKKKPSEEPMAADDVPEGAVIYRPGMVPAQRQIFYHYCDMKVPEVEALLAQEPPAGYLCHQKRGWLPPNADETCRDHIYKYVKESLIATHNADIKFEQDSSEEGSDSEDDDSASISAMDVDETLNT